MSAGIVVKTKWRSLRNQFDSEQRPLVVVPLKIHPLRTHGRMWAVTGV